MCQSREIDRSQHSAMAMEEAVPAGIVKFGETPWAMATIEKKNGGEPAPRGLGPGVLGDSPATTSASAASAGMASTSSGDLQRLMELEDSVAALQVRCAELQRENDALQRSVHETRDQGGNYVGSGGEPDL